MSALLTDLLPKISWKVCSTSRLYLRKWTQLLAFKF